MKLIIFYFVDKPGRLIGGKAVSDVGEVSFEASLFLCEVSRGVNLLELNDSTPFPPPPAFIGIKLRNELVAVFDIEGFLRLGAGE